ncbi:MAG TPA: two-component regulator propeller domain-containing protein [Acidobacteriaceae bacterium]|nr:two-component regulator propeller domain-containing protein [Acidobacteriaceae bacterium]
MPTSCRRTLRFAALAAFLLCVAMAHALDPHQDLRRYGYQSWQTDSGLPQNTVHAVLQTIDGYMWFATEAGLVRFDSVNFTVYTHKNTPQLPSDLVYSLLQDNSGTLWIGTANGVTSYRDGVFRAYPDTSGSSIWSLFQDRKGRIWIATSAGLSRLQGSRFINVPGVPPLDQNSHMIEPLNGSLWLSTTEGVFHASPGNATYFTLAGSPVQIQALLLDRKGRLWAGTQNGVEICSASALTPGSTADCSPFAPMAGKDVDALAETPQGGIWIGADSGLWFTASAVPGPKSQQSNPPSLKSYTQSDGLPSNRVNLLYCDREGVIWIGTAGGLARYAYGSIEAFTPKEGFSSNLILSIAEDREGNLWLGTESGGVDVLRDRKFTTYTSADGISNDHILSVMQDHSGAVWLGTSGGGLDHATLATVNKTGFSTLTAANGLSSNIILSIAGAPNGDLWVGTPDGLDRMHNGNVTVFTSADGLADDFVRSLCFDDHGTLWIGTRRGLSQYRNGQFTTWTALDGLGSNLVGAMLQGSHGGMWIATLGGLTHWSNGRFRNYTEKDGLSNRIITALHLEPDGTLWIGTDGGGLNRWRNGVITPIRPTGADLPAYIYGILDGGEGNLWLSSNQGIYRVNRDALNRYADGQIHHVLVDSYGIADGMKISEASSGGHPAAWRMQNGTLWFATLRGVSTVDPEHLPMNRVPPLMAIERFSVDDIPEPSSELFKPGTASLKIAAGARRFAFDYAALSFAAPNKVRFRYQLVGFDHAWIAAGSQRSAYYTNLPPGHYTFRVIACNNDGIWSAAPASISFQLRPYFYQTIWFYVLLILSIGLLGYLAYLWRLRQVESRFTAVLAERNRIAREIHDTLAQGFVAVSVQLQIVGRTLSQSADAARQHLDEAQELVRTGLEDARRAIWELRSQNSENQDFASQLLQMAERVTASSGIKTQVEVHGAYRPLPARTESELLRIAQEAVTNVVRHAGATRVRILLAYTRRHVKMTISDDGRGFSFAGPSISGDHFGITGMKERAQQIGGRVKVTSKEGEGTQVYVEVAAGSKTL